MTESNPRPRRRMAIAPLAVLIAAGLVAAQPASALPRCATETDQTVFELEALKTELMVVATTCKLEEQYNTFIRRYQPALAQNGRAFGQYFARTHGSTRAGQRQNDIYITNLANARASAAQQLGGDFCPRNRALFDEVMALSGPTDLPAYAAGKDLLSAGVTACEGAPAPRATTTAAARRTTGNSRR